jgi:ABC-type glycerol-3-phosphate transport system permease component
MYEKERDRRFQFELAKVQTEFEYHFTMMIGILAISYGLLQFYKDNLLGLVATNVIILLVGVIGLPLVYYTYRKRFAEIKKKYIENDF